MPETILIVDDEESVRRTFREWLESAQLDCAIRVAADAEDALRHAQREPIDLAILDWNLGTGMDGLRLLEDLIVFRPDVVAILVTGYASQATPLMALRMGIRDFLDKNHELTREAFLTSVRKQLDKIRPAKHERELREAQAAFRSAVEQVLPLIRTTTALSDSPTFASSTAALCRFLCDATSASDAVLLVHHDGASRVYSCDGSPLTVTPLPFAQSIAAAAVSMGAPSIIADLQTDPPIGAQWQPFERNRNNLLAVPLAIGPNVVAVVELFDKPSGFTQDDRRIVQAAGAIGSELLRQAMAERQTHQMLFDAVNAALNATQMPKGDSIHVEQSVRETLRQNLDRSDSPDALALAEAIQLLGAKYGPPAVRQCLTLVRQLTATLDELVQP